MSETGDQAPAKPVHSAPRKRAQKSSRIHGRSLSDFEPLLPAEKKLKNATARGEVTRIGDERPQESTKENTVRASFLRFLLLGGDTRAPTHEVGVYLHGAWISGTLDIANNTTISAIACKQCAFDKPIILRRSNLPGLFLSGSSVPGIRGDGAVIKGGVFLRNGFKSTSTIRLLGAQIDSNLDCENAHFDGGGSHSLAADGAVIAGSVFLRNGFKADGSIRFLGAKIGGDLVCRKAEIKSQKGDALAARNMIVSGAFFFRDLASPTDNVNLDSASVGVLVDDAHAWGNDLVLDGFSYGSIGGRSPSNATERLAWLNKQKKTMSGLSGSGSDFRPQPWKQLQKVLREMGHNEGARQVAIAFEHRLRKADLIGVAPPQWGWLRRKLYRHLSRFFHWCFWILTGYGYRPMRLMAWMLAVWLCSAAFYWFTALPQRDVFAPSNPLVFQHPHYQVCAPETPESKAELAKPPEQQSVIGAGNWYLCEKLRGEYTGFSPLAYSLDVLLPLVDLQQQKDWGPIIPTPKSSWWRELLAPSWGHAARLVIWFQTLFGWVASLLLVAIVSGLTKRRED